METVVVHYRQTRNYTSCEESRRITMHSGLSLRVERTLGEFLPTIAATAPPKQHDATTAVDLSSAQNEVLRPELLEFFKSTLENGVTSKVY